MRKIKKITITLLMILLLSVQSFTFADAVTLSYNGKGVETDNAFDLKEGVLYVNPTQLLTPLGLDVEWLEYANLVTIKDGDNYISFTLDDSTGYYNNETFDTGYDAYVVNGVSYVPFEFLMDFLPEFYSYDSQYLKVDIVSSRFDKEAVAIEEPTYTDEDVLWLARIADVEARGGSEYKKLAVANVVLNRVKSPNFPNSVYDVIFASGQFPPAHWESFPTLEPKDESFRAAKRALEGENNVESCLYFNNRPFSSKADDFYKNIEGDYFYY